MSHVKIDTPMGEVTLTGTTGRYNSGDDTLRYIRARLTVERPGTKTRSLWDVDFTTSIKATSDDDHVSLYGCKLNGDGPNRHVASTWSRGAWSPVLRQIEREIRPMVRQWIDDNGETIKLWQAELYLHHADQEARKAKYAREDAARHDAEAKRYRERAAELGVTVEPAE